MNMNEVLSHLHSKSDIKKIVQFINSIIIMCYCLFLQFSSIESRNFDEYSLDEISENFMIN